METLPKSLLFPLQTISGVGSVAQLIPECLVFGRRGMLVHGRSLVRSGMLSKLLAAAPDDQSICAWRHPGGEPTLDQLEDLLSAARGHGAEWIAAVGGGSVLDIAKAAAGLLEAPLPVQVYHDGEPIEASTIPFVAAPTTAGTGSEATSVSVLTNSVACTKRSIRHPSLLPRCVILDSELLQSCPPSVIASAGMDALTQAIEAFTSRHATWLSDVVALKAVEMINMALPTVYENSSDPTAADALLEGSYLAGIALSNARLGVVHGLAHPLGVRYHQPHGVVCSVCLLPALNFNRAAMGEKYDALEAALHADPVTRVTELLATLKITSPFFGEAVVDREGIIRETLASGSTAANPRIVTEADVEALLLQIFG
ncbi:MAG: iron-containing alcohol dehydrogenase [Verrucomicrobia bacterium]|jgi:alcohol dehydrogenase class IV|nr:iron-containing alcohol dehydrogenase [Verrucomicrobiota bacterium]